MTDEPTSGVRPPREPDVLVKVNAALRAIIQHLYDERAKDAAEYAALEAACKAKDEQISECSRLASRVLELDEALRVAKAELENHTEVPGVSEYVLPAIEAALSSSTNPEPREN